jgi:CrcB protein
MWESEAMTLLMVALGGALGSVARYGVAYSTSRWVGNPVPYATALVNLAGCAVAGMLLGLTAGSRLTLTFEQRAFLFSGILGGLTTFSGFGMDTLVLLQEGRGATAALNVAGQVTLGIGLLLVCYTLARR